jgi:hypothetical protein
MSTNPKKRTTSEANFSPRKDSKKQNIFSVVEAEKALDTEDLKGMLVDQRAVLAAMGDYVSELTGVPTEEKDPRKLLKLLLVEGWIDSKGRISNKEDESILVWKEVRKFNTQQSLNMIHNLNPDLERTEIDEVKATTVAELVDATNKSLKITETVLNKLIDNSAETKNRVSEAEQKQVRADLENEYLKLLGHDLDLKDCNKSNAWEISAFAKDKMIKNYYSSNKDAADKKCDTAKEVVDNKYVQAHNLLIRMTINAMGKTVKANKAGVVTVALIMTFATEGDKEAFRTIAKDCGVRAQPSLPKGYIEQKGMIMNLYKAHISKNGGDNWVKVDVRPCRPEDPMSFTVQTKRAESRDTKWTTAGKVVVVLPATWGRLSGQQKEEYLNQSFSRF